MKVKDLLAQLREERIELDAAISELERMEPESLDGRRKGGSVYGGTPEDGGPGEAGPIQ